MANDDDNYSWLDEAGKEPDGGRPAGTDNPAETGNPVGTGNADVPPPLPPNLQSAVPRAATASSIPQPPKKRRFKTSTLLKAGAGIVAVVFAIVVARGTTSAGNLQVGDCFETPSGERVSTVDDQDCSGPHEAEVYAEVTGTVAESENLCLDGFLENVSPEAFSSLPDDIDFYLLSDGDDHLCIIQSASGSLVGSLVAGN